MITLVRQISPPSGPVYPRIPSAQLVQAKLETSFKSTQRLLDRLILVTLETGAITLIVTLVQLIFYVKFPTNGRQQVSV